MKTDRSVFALILMLNIMKKLLLRCDDFGSATGANEAYMRLAETGLKFSASIMICGPACSKKELELLVQSAPHIALGIHGVVNAEWDMTKWGPVGDLKRARESGLVDVQDNFHANPNLLKQVPPEVIINEIRAQIQRGLDWGLPFSYLDEHMGFSWVHNQGESLTALAKEFGLVYRPKIARLESGKTENGLIANWKIGLHAMGEDPCLMVTHPVIDDTSTRLFYKAPAEPGLISRERQVEFDAMVSLEWRETLAHENIELITYRELPPE